MSDEVWIDLKILVPHPDRELAGSTLHETDGKYQLIRESIQVDGITDPIKVQSGTNVIIGGHTRCRIALEFNMPEVPVRYYDVDDETARYMMVTDNHKRIGDEKDPMKLAWTFRVVVDTIGIPHGGNRKARSGIDDTGENKRKTKGQIAASFGMKESHFYRHLDLLKLIPELQTLVSQLKIGVKAGSLLSRLKPENQRKVFESIPPDDMNKPNWRLTENAAKNLVKVYEPSRLQVDEDSTDSPDEEGTVHEDGTEMVNMNNVDLIGLDIDDDDVYLDDNEPTMSERVDRLEQGGRHDYSAPDKLEINLAANQFVERPNRKKVFNVSKSVDLDYGEKGLSATKKVEDSAKQIARQLVLMEDADKRSEFVKTQLSVALDKQFNWVERMDAELIPLRVLVADQLDDKLALRWLELCEQMERVHKKLSAMIRPIEPEVESHE